MSYSPGLSSSTELQAEHLDVGDYESDGTQYGHSLNDNHEAAESRRSKFIDQVREEKE